MESLKTLSFTVAILMFLGGGILTLLGGGDGVWEDEGIEHVQWPHDRVFDWLTDPELRQDWVEGLVSTTVEPGGGLKKGSRIVETVRVDGVQQRRVLEVTAFEPGSVFAYRTTEDDVEIAVHYKVGNYQTSEQSRIDYRVKVQFPGMTGRVLEPLLKSGIRSRLDAEFERLTTLVMSPDR